MTGPLFANKNVSLPQDFQSLDITSYKHSLSRLILLNETDAYLVYLLTWTGGGKEGLPNLPLETQDRHLMQ